MTQRATSVCGIDLSLTSTGVCRIDWREGDAGPRSRTYRVESGPAGRTLADQHRRMVDVCGRVLAAAGAGLDLAVIEGPDYGRGRQSGAHDLSGLWWMVASSLLSGGTCAVVQVPPSTLKVYVVGFGGSRNTKVSKRDILAAVERRYPSYLTGGSHDVAEAIGLAAMACRRMGRPIDFLPDRYVRAMESVKWPALDDEG